MEKEIKKIYVDCEQRFLSITQEDNLEVIENTLFDWSEFGANLRLELGIASENDDALWSVFQKRLSPEGAYLVKSFYGVIGVFASLKAAEAHAERAAKEHLEQLIEVDNRLLATWSQTSRLIQEFAKIAPQAKQVLNELKKVHDVMNDHFGDELWDLHDDLKDSYVAQEAVAITILTVANRLQGKRDPQAVYDYYISTEEETYKPYVLPVRTRFKK